jgi:gas vesicle protein GvpL/GvpF
LPRKTDLVAIRAGKLIAAAAHVDAAPASDEAGLRAHDAVVRSLWNAAQAVLPVRFGAVFADEAAARASLSRRADELLAALAEVRGCAQMTLRVAEEPAAESEGGPGTRYLLARARAQKAPEIDSIRPALEPLLRAERAERKAGVVTVFHLIARDRAGDYRAALTNFRAIVSGPFPPYAFAPEEPA